MIKLLKVRGDSLVPEYRDGDFVLVCKIPIFFGRLRPGDVVAFCHPQYGMLIKKIAAVLSDEPGGNTFLPQRSRRTPRKTARKEYFVTGTHPLSVDSRQFGPIRRQAMLGKVIAHVRRRG